MPIPRSLLLCFTLMLFFSGKASPYLKDCDKLKVKAEILANESGASVEIKTEDAESPCKYLFYKHTGELISQNFDKNSIDRLEKGKYFCTVVDKNNCKKTIEIEIK